MNRPLIGLCTALERARWSVWDQRAALLPWSYVEALQRAGGQVLMLPPDARAVAVPDATLDLLDGLILAGGADIDPRSYGAAPEAETQGSVIERDAFEIALVRRALEREIPTLGICRGMQLLNVALGGTLIQHLPARFGHDEHRRVLGSFDGSDHFVRLAPGSLAARVAGEEHHATKSHHHQGVDAIGAGLLVSGWAEIDDLPEAIEAPGPGFVLGVQWHPEADPGSPIVAALVDRAETDRAARGRR